MAVVIHGDAGEPGRAPEGDPQEAWVELLTATRHLEHPPKVIVASRQADDRLWAEVLHLGGYDVLPLPLEVQEVMRTVGMAWLEWKREIALPVRAMAAAAH
jgi:hypothetical protein